MSTVGSTTARGCPLVAEAEGVYVRPSILIDRQVELQHIQVKGPRDKRPAHNSKHQQARVRQAGDKQAGDQQAHRLCSRQSVTDRQRTDSNMKRIKLLDRQVASSWLNDSKSTCRQPAASL